MERKEWAYEKEKATQMREKNANVFAVKKMVLQLHIS